MSTGKRENPIKRENPKRAYRALLIHNKEKFLETLGDNIMQGPARRQHALFQLDLLQAWDLASALATFRRNGDESFLQLAAIRGPARRQHARLQLDLLQASELTSALATFRLNGDESLLQLAAIFHGDVEVMQRLGALCPRLLLLQRQGEYEGQTVLHTLVSKQNVAGANALLQHPSLKEPWVLLNTKAVGPRFYGTVMMGELPLSVAALTFNVEMVDVLVARGARLHAVNTRGDTALHALVRFAAVYPQKEAEVRDMLRELHKRLQTPGATPSPMAEPKSVWLMENREGLTVLRLAAALAQPSLFKLVLELEGVYCQLDRHDGLFDSLLYDVTEIDPVARRRWRNQGGHHHHHHHHHGSGVAPIDGIPSPSHRQKPFLDMSCCCPGADAPAPSAAVGGGVGGEGGGDGGGGGGSGGGRGRSASVLEIVCETGRVEKAFEVLNTFVVRSIVKAKWRAYRPWFLLWAALHVLLMALLTAYAVYKAQLIGAARTTSETTTAASSPSSSSSSSNSTTNASTAPGPESSSAKESFVEVTAILMLPVSVLVLVWEGLRLARGTPLNLWLIHHNGLYRLQLVVFALCLIADSVWYLIKGPDNNFFLILALLVGWWFTSFFLRPWQKFSFFTVMLQKVLLGDMLRFSTIIVLELLAFSVAMYITFVSTPGDLPEEFRHLGVTLLTMFKLMLGLGEVEVLYDAAHPWLAITLFVLFVLLTYILLLNALIAMMSNTCSLVSENKVSQWELQRLSVVLMLESMLLCECLLYNSGRPLHVARFDLKRKQMIQEVRYFTKVNSVQTSYVTDGAAILRRKSMMQTQRFEDIHAVMASVGDLGHVDLLASFTHQHALLAQTSLHPHHGGYDDNDFTSPDFFSNEEPYSASTPSSFYQQHQAAPAPPGKDLSSYNTNPKEFPHHKGGRGVVLSRQLSAINEQPESVVGGGGGGYGGRGWVGEAGKRVSEVRRSPAESEGLNSSSYISVRQSLLQALLATQFPGRLTAAQQQRQQSSSGRDLGLEARGGGGQPPHPEDPNPHHYHADPWLGQPPRHSQPPWHGQTPPPPHPSFADPSPSSSHFSSHHHHHQQQQHQQARPGADREEEADYSSSDDQSRDQDHHHIRSPHTPKAVALQEKRMEAAPSRQPQQQQHHQHQQHHQQHQQQHQQSPRTELAHPKAVAAGSSPPKTRRKRHNSERLANKRRDSAAADTDPKAKSLEFLHEGGSSSTQLLPNVRPREARSEERLQGVGVGVPVSVTQMLTGRQLNKVMPKLPSPDVFVISNKHPGSNSEA